MADVNMAEDKLEHPHTIDRVDTLNSNGHSLSKQVTVSMSPEQYERLFFQPSAPKGDLRKRLGPSSNEANDSLPVSSWRLTIGQETLRCLDSSVFLCAIRQQCSFCYRGEEQCLHTV